MKYVLFLILTIVVIVFLLNAFLNMRSKTNSNKFVENILKKLGITFVKFKRQGWAIKTFSTEKKLIELRNKDIPKNDWFQVNEKECGGIADPFLFFHEQIYYMFFEYENIHKGADIAYATSTNGKNWNFQSKVLEENFHQSFPYVFCYDSEVFMLPESYQSNQVRLYKAMNFPNSWKLDKILFEGKKLADTIYLEKDDHFFWLTTNLESDELELYYSEGLYSDWITHPMSPISKDKKNNRNAGKIIIDQGNFYRPAQDATSGYGSGINLYQIEEITINTYKEKLLVAPLFFKDKGVMKDAIHHLSLLESHEGNIVAVDGANFAINSLKI